MAKLSKDQKHQITFTLNGKKATGYAEPRMLLSDFLRQEMALTGVHVGCEHGVCGACTIRINGDVGRSCLMLAVQVDGQSVDTVESLSGDSEELNPLQKSFKKHHGLQCGYCTPGILMSTTAFLEENQNPTETDIREMLSGHICRCTGYVGMTRAIMEVAEDKETAKGGRSD